MKSPIGKLAVAGLLLSVLFPVDALAGPIDMREVNLATGSIIVDTDMALLNGFYGTDESSVLSYGATVSQGGWYGVLQGAYLGNSVSVSYQGTVFSGTWASGQDVFTCPTSTCIYSSSSGQYGSDVWNGDGFWVYEDPNLKASLTATGVKLSVGVNQGIVGADLGLEKDLLLKELTMTGSVSLLGGVGEAGADFKFNQTTGIDSSGLFYKVLWGFFSGRKTIDRTRLFTPPPGGAPALPPPPPPLQPGQLVVPEMPDGGVAGFNPDVNVAGQEYMYVRNVPEPSTIFLLLLGLFSMRFFACRPDLQLRFGTTSH